MVLRIKLIRDLWESRSQYAAVVLLIGLGVAFFGAAYMSYQNLDGSYQTSYDRLAFEDFSITVPEAPSRAVDRVRRIPGVVAVEGRLVQDVTVEVGGRRDKKLVGRLISIPIARQPTVDQLLMVRGAYPAKRTAREVVLESSFADKRGIDPGDSIDVIDRGLRTSFKVVGVARSAEYIYVVRSKQDVMPSTESFGVMFAEEDVLGQVVGKAGTITELKVRVSPTASRSSVMREAKRVLAMYRPDDPVPREEQPSYQLLQQDVQGFQAYSVMFPAMFLSVAGLTIYALLSRLVHSQRTTIGLMRALGFSSGQVVRHYLSASMSVGVLASAIGSVVGIWLSGVITRYYLTFLASPFTEVMPRWGAITFGFAIGVGVCLIAGYRPALWAARVQPAETLRPEPPGVGRVLRIDAVFPWLSLAGRIPMRNLVRQPRRSISTLVGVVASVSLIVTARGIQDSTVQLMADLGASMFREDLRLDLVAPADRTTVQKVRSMPGVIWAEGDLGMPMTFRKGDRSYDALAIGVLEGSLLRNLVDAKRRPVRPSSAGGIFGPALRSKLQLETGDTVIMTLSSSLVEGHTPRTTPIRVAGFNEEPVGTIVYVRERDLRLAVRGDYEIPPGGVNSIRVMTRDGWSTGVRRALLALDAAGAVTSTEEIVRMFEEMMKMMRSFIFAMFLFGGSLAFVIMFNTISMNIIERESEIATMRMLGMGTGRIAWLVTQENLWLSAIGLAVGLPFGKWLCESFVIASQTQEQQELFSFAATILPDTYVLAAGIVVGSTLLAQVFPLRRVSRVDLCGIVKKAAR